ncbi:putative urate catabolism protein [Thalassovita gelatinovora]|uniref:Chitooligosaccharide deacetylase n=1 Tax=Thalassovita gelatinovora TaxID=53501 RepID=A0A0P1F3S2_THAGE|nr:polysaccharide deacetylase family protein [Thalassovita gelatinovora]QIZ81790.1 polysaccharide deacetylase family protein [Thalassovita gelatinovora]CUH62318.1 putative urate catabolism protein [Thalassovita gelatinovora]SER15525.1 Polysaccharide deacetylase [Thalassovita gelatinovora]
MDDYASSPAALAGAIQANPRIPYSLANRQPPLAGPDGKRLIVNMVVNIEYWPFDREMPRKLLTAPHGREQVPDVPNFCWADYGMRVGMARLLSLFTARDLPVSASINATVIDAYPECAEAIRDAGWEFVGHGMHQTSLSTETSEADVIRETLKKLRAFTGKPVRGWLSPGLRETAATPDILAAEGIEYLCDWNVDDVPHWMRATPRDLIAMPYTLELNDSVVHAVEKHSSAEMLRRLETTLTCFDCGNETAGAKVLGIGLHPHLIGVPHRLPYLAEMLDLLQARDDVVFMTGAQIADWFSKEAVA